MFIEVIGYLPPIHGLPSVFNILILYPFPLLTPTHNLPVTFRLSRPVVFKGSQEYYNARLKNKLTQLEKSVNDIKNLTLKVEAHGAEAKKKPTD